MVNWAPSEAIATPLSSFFSSHPTFSPRFLQIWRSKPESIRLWLAGSTFLFGLAMLGHGFARNWYTVAGLRVPLGAFEGLLFPGAVFLISSWYPRYETQKRISAFYLGATGFAGFSAIFAYAFSLLRGTGRLYGRAMLGWRWIFIMSAIMTFAAAIIGLLTIPNFPAKATFLTAEERQLVLDRINVDRSDANEEKMTKAGVFQQLRDWKIWTMGFLFLCSTLPSYAFSYFLPVIILNFGFSLRDTQLLVCPPYIAAIVIGMTSAYFSDKLRIRFPFIAAGAVVSATGSLILGYGKSNGVRYFGAFLAVIGCSSNAPAIVSWSQNNVTGYTARAVTSAVIVASGGLGGIIASVSFQSKDAATGYRPGLWTTVASQIATLIVGSIYIFTLRRENLKVKQEGKILANTPGFLYTL